MQPEAIILSEVNRKTNCISQKEKDKYHTTSMWNPKCGTSEPTMKQKQNHRHREQTRGCQGAGAGGGQGCTEGGRDGPGGGEGGRDGPGVWCQQLQMQNRGPAAQHRELYPTF